MRQMRGMMGKKKHVYKNAIGLDEKTAEQEKDEEGSSITESDLGVERPGGGM